MSIAKRMLALAAAGATALVLGGALSASHHATPAAAGGATIGAIGCTNAADNATAANSIQFAAQGPTALTAVITSSVQAQNAPAGAGTFFGANLGVGSLNLAYPNSVVVCGAAFQDAIAAPAPAPGALVALDADPNTIDGGTITYTMNSVASLGTGFGVNLYPGTTSLGSPLTTGVILESNSNVANIPCGSTGAPTGTSVGNVPANILTITAMGGIESCQGATPTTPLSGQTFAAPNFAVSPTQANLIHVGFRPGASFGIIGGQSPAISLGATWARYASLTSATYTATGCALPCPVIAIATGPSVISTNQVAIPIVTPIYAMTLTPAPATIPAASGTGQGSTITAQLYRVQQNVTCYPLVLGAATNLFVTCPALPTPVAGGTIVGSSTTAGLAGAEAGVVTLSTTAGVFGAPAQTSQSGQQIISVHCGALPGFAPSVLIPQPGAAYNFAFGSCQTATATLFGGGAAGTAVITGTFVGDLTGGNAFSQTTVVLAPVGNTVSLTRGCNEVITGPGIAANTPVTTIVSSVTPSGAVVSVWMFNNSLHAFQAGFFNTAGAPTDFTTVGPNQSLFICVSGAAAFPTGAY